MNAEEQLKQDIWKAVYSDRLLGMDRDAAVRTAELVIKVLKDVPDTQVGWFIRKGKIQIVEEYDWEDYADGSEEFTVWVEQEPDEE